MTSTFQFPTFLELLNFAVIVDSDNCKINRFDLTLSGDFEEADIELAVRAFEGKLLQEQEACK